MNDVSILNVELYGETIGTITNVGGDRTLFAFTDAYVENAERPTLGLSFVDTSGEIGRDFRPYQKQLMPFFSNLLPEGHMRAYLAERAGVNHEREFHLLWALGNDLSGAITISSADGDKWSTEDGTSSDENKQHHENAPRFSLTGVQLKFSAIEEATGGLTIPASGVGGSWIVKLSFREFDGVPENEFSMMALASMIGMNVPRIDLVETDAIKNVPEGIERFGTNAFVSTIPYIAGDRSALNVSRSKAFTDFNLDELHHFAAKAAIPKKLVTTVARQTIDAFHDVWDREAKNLPMSQAVRQAIEVHMQTVPLIGEL